MDDCSVFQSTHLAASLSQRIEACIFFFKGVNLGGFRGGAVVENLPANAGDTGSSPGLGRPHAAEQLGP